jgi:hypothetical protein
MTGVTMLGNKVIIKLPGPLGYMSRAHLNKCCQLCFIYVSMYNTFHSDI